MQLMQEKEHQNEEEDKNENGDDNEEEEELNSVEMLVGEIKMEKVEYMEIWAT